MDKNKAIAARRLRRKRHIRHKLAGTAERPRLTVSRSHKNISCQVIDDFKGVTLASASTLCKELRDQIAGNGGNVKGAEIVGLEIAKRAKALGIKQLKFDRNGCKYHGRLAALADALRKEGIEV